jgi:hypothetical protein
MASDKKRKEADRNRKREQRAASRDSQSEIEPVDSDHATCSIGKRPRLDSSADSLSSVQSNASTPCERARKHRANMTEEQKAAVRAKDAERKRTSRANSTEAMRATERERNAERYRITRATMTPKQKAIIHESNRQIRSNMPDKKKEDNRAKDTRARQTARSNTPSESTERSNLAKRERRTELAEMRASFLTPPDSSTTPSAQTIEEAFGIPFFQSTKGVCCCRTALNNALGGNVFSYETLEVANIDNVNIELEETAIQECLESKGVRCDSMNNIRDLVLISEINSVGTWILRNNNTGGHYVVLKRLHIDGPLWLLDSAKQAPEIIASYFYELTESLRNEDDLRNLFLLYIRYPDGYRPQCLREPSEVGIRRMITTAPSNDCFVIIDNSFKYF